MNRLFDIRIMILQIVALFTLFNCATNKSTSLDETNKVEQGFIIENTTPPEYVLQIGDRIGIKFYYNSELDEETIIRPDGKISLQLVDEVQAAGLTPKKLDEVLTEKYSSKLQTPVLTVMVREFAYLKVFVGGEVNLPGIYPIVGRLSALQSIFQAGGFKRSAHLSKVVVLRNQGTDDPLFISLDLNKNLQRIGAQPVGNDMLLQPYDIVFVPKTPIAKLGDFVDQYINQLIPAALSFGLTYSFTRTID